MKWFKKMIEVATDLGIYWMEDDDHLPRKCDPSMFFNRIEKCYPFVFVPTHNEEPEKLEHKGKVEIDPPFEVMSIEMLGDCAISVMDDGDKDLPVDLADIYCIMNCEFSGKDGIHYGQFFLIKYKETRSTGDWMVVSTGLLSSMVKKFLDRINTEEDGVEIIRHKFKMGKGKHKRFHTIRKIIHIKPKKVGHPRSERGNTIDYSHRFVRRGHWRNLGESKLGKNRQGDYCVSGMTWVNESKPIGNPEKPFIKKTRLVGE